MVSGLFCMKRLFLLVLVWFNSLLGKQTWKAGKAFFAKWFFYIAGNNFPPARPRKNTFFLGRFKENVFSAVSPVEKWIFAMWNLFPLCGKWFFHFPRLFSQRELNSTKREINSQLLVYHRKSLAPSGLAPLASHPKLLFLAWPQNEFAVPARHFN